MNDTNTPALLKKLMSLSEYNPGATNVLAEFIMANNAMDTLYGIKILEIYNIKGSKIWMLYKDCCACNIEKFLGTEVYSQEEVDASLNNYYGIPFIDDSVEFTKENSEDFKNLNLLKMIKYAKENAKICKPKIQEIMNLNERQ